MAVDLFTSEFMRIAGVPLCEQLIDDSKGVTGYKVELTKESVTERSTVDKVDRWLWFGEDTGIFPAPADFVMNRIPS